MSEIDLSIGFADAMTKLSWSHVTGDSLADAPREIEVIGARNEVVGAQVRLTAGHDFVLTVDRTNWLHALGFCPRVRLDVHFPTLPADAIETFVVGYVEGDDRRQWMEVLDRAGYAELPAYRPQAVYVHIRIPADLDAGVHEGWVRAYTQHGFEDETPFWEGTIRLQVADVTLPDVADRSFQLGLWQHCRSIARYHHVPLWGDAHFALIDKYYASLAQLGQKAVTVIATEIPWSGQRCFRDRSYPSYLFEHAIVDATRDDQAGPGRRLGVRWRRGARMQRDARDGGEIASARATASTPDSWPAGCGACPWDSAWTSPAAAGGPSPAESAAWTPLSLPPATTRRPPLVVSS